MNFVFPIDNARKIHKFGVDITIYDTDTSSGLVYEETQAGHCQEWYDDISTYQWYIIEGTGEFIINDQKHKVKKGDLVVVPPKNRIHYFGKLKMLLVTTPNFDPKNEHEVRLIKKSEAK